LAGAPALDAACSSIVRRPKMTTMENLPEVVSRHEWLAARKQLLLKKKELTRARARLNA
jgi:predicted dithiol-disulfide oxidoreductase (DUF899 family)